MESIRHAALIGAVSLSALSVAVLGGCNLLDPSIAGGGMWGDPEHVGKPQRILSEITGSEPVNEPPNAELPNASDLKPIVRAYRIGAGDTVSVMVPDLLSLGVVYQHQAQISATGFITLPHIGRLLAAGKTARQFEEKIAVILKGAKVLTDPQVTVQVLIARQQTFIILGQQVARPGAYQLLRSNFSVLDALGLAGDVSSGIDYIYVIRASEVDDVVPTSDEVEQFFARPRGGALEPGAFPTEPGITPMPGPAAPSSTGPVPDQPVAPPVQPQPGGNGGALIPWTQPATPGTGVPGPTTFQPREVSPSEHGARGQWRWDTARKRFVQTGDPRTFRANFQVTSSTQAGDLTQAELAASQGKRRVVKIDVKALKNGDARQNIILRKDDIVYVPPIEMGEFYMGGRIARPGVYTLTGRKLTVKQAIIAAGGPTQLADTTRVDIVRRIGPNQEVTVMVNLVDIWEGRAPNFFIKPNDIINIAEGWWNRPLAIVLNAFRLTYGFGFVYDKNFADEDNDLF